MFLKNNEKSFDEALKDTIKYNDALIKKTNVLNELKKQNFTVIQTARYRKQMEIIKNNPNINPELYELFSTPNAIKALSQELISADDILAHSGDTVAISLMLSDDGIIALQNKLLSPNDFFKISILTKKEEFVKFKQELSEKTKEFKAQLDEESQNPMKKQV